jgi:integrase
VLQDFIQVCGDKPIGAYSKSDGRAFVALLRQLPANIDKLQGGLDIHTRDLVKLSEIARSRGLAPQDDATTNKKIGIVQQCFRWIMARFDECSASPVDGMRLTLRRGARDQKDPFTLDQLNAIFAAPVFAGCESELHWSKPGSLVLRSSPKFWVPLIALFTGMRSGEICQLTRDHVRVHDGVNYFALSKDLRLKNDASIRSVPVHRVLIECGLLDFVAQSEGRLFPHLPKHSSGRLSDAFGKHFSRFLRSLGIKTENTDFHSFRHNFIAAAEASGRERPGARGPQHLDRRHGQVLQHSAMREQIVLLEDHRDLMPEGHEFLVALQRLDGEGADTDRSAVDRRQAVDAAQDRRLARARRPDDADHATVLHGQGYALEHGEGVEGFMDVLKLDQRARLLV